tara:strand:- start:5572 stop:5949 length:378 start_codon:yes stop_codon:yes gene_type:complete
LGRSTKARINSKYLKEKTKMSVIIEESKPRYAKLKVIVKNCLDDFKAMELQLKGMLNDNMRWQPLYSSDSVDHFIKVIESDIKHGFIDKDILEIPFYKFHNKKYSWVNVFEFQEWIKINQKEKQK